MASKPTNPAPAAGNEVMKPPALPGGTGMAVHKMWLNSGSFRAALQDAIGKHLSPELYVSAALAALNETPGLLECTGASFTRAVLTLARLKLMPNGRDAYLIPFRNNKGGKSVTEIQVLVGYRGMIAILERTGRLKRIVSGVVCKNDVFEHDLGLVTKHTYGLEMSRGPVIGAYASITNVDGMEMGVVLSKEEIETRRKRSKASTGPWVTDYAAMARKSAVRALCNGMSWAESPEMQAAMRMEDEADRDEAQALEEAMNAAAATATFDLSTFSEVPEGNRGHGKELPAPAEEGPEAEEPTEQELQSLVTALSGLPEKMIASIYQQQGLTYPGPVSRDKLDAVIAAALTAQAARR